MYKIVETDKREQVSWGEVGNFVTSLLTLADEYGGRAQIINDDHCYVLLGKKGDIYKTSSWWFKEAVQGLRILPDPD